jgi:hypothetical protein
MTSIDATFRILALCARVPGSGSVSERLLRDTTALASWDALLHHAEDHGLEPLLRAHLLAAGISAPTSVTDHLRTRWMQHAHACAVRTRVIAGVLSAMEREAIPLLMLKGAALAHVVYGNPLLRPMRDVDALVRARDARRAREVLKACGFSVTGPPVPPDHHHVRGMSTTVDGATVTIELHSRLLQPTPLLRPVEYDDVCRDAQPFEWSGREVRTLGREDMLWHVYAHAFAINVTRPAIRLISVADLVTLTEAWIDAIDWENVRRRYGRVWRALPLLHHLTPWSPRVLEKLRWDVGEVPDGVRPVAARLAWSADACRDVVWPPEWWLRVRYGIRGRAHWAWSRVVGHPIRLLISAARSARRRLASVSVSD